MESREELALAALDPREREQLSSLLRKVLLALEEGRTEMADQGIAAPTI